MDQLHALISTLSQAEHNRFEAFVAAESVKGQQKVLLLFRHFYGKEAPSAEVLQKAIYGNEQYDAYKALRKRLLALLQKFISLKLLESDSSSASKALSYMHLARYMHAHANETMALRYLQKAEQLGLENDLYEVLNSVYLFQLEFRQQTDEKWEAALLARWQQNKQLLQQNEQVEMALHLVQKRIDQNQGSLNVEKLVKQSLQQLHFGHEVALQPRFIYQLTQLNRRNMLAQKDFLGLKPYVENQYQRIAQQGGFKSKTSYYEAGFLYMLAHMAYRNRAFAESGKWLQKLQWLLQKHPETSAKAFAAKSLLLEAALAQFTKQLPKALQLLKDAESHPLFQSSPKHQYNRMVNLAIALALQGDYRSARWQLHQVQRSDQWLAKHLGEEWLLKKSMIEAILHLELGDVDLFDARVRFVKRRFKPLFQQKLYARVPVFVGFLEQLSQTTELPKLAEKLENGFDWRPVEEEDLQAMVFYAWLKAKVQQRDAYMVLMELVNKSEEE